MEFEASVPAVQRTAVGFTDTVVLVVGGSGGLKGGSSACDALTPRSTITTNAASSMARAKTVSGTISSRTRCRCCRNDDDQTCTVRSGSRIQLDHSWPECIASFRRYGRTTVVVVLTILSTTVHSSEDVLAKATIAPAMKPSIPKVTA